MPAVNELSLEDVVGGLPPEHRRSRRGSERRRKKRRRRTWAVVVLCLLVVAGAVGGAWAGLRPLVSRLDQPSDYRGPGSGSVQVTVPDGSTGTAIGQLLAAKGVVRTAGSFVSAYDANANSGSIQPGTYALKLQMSSAEAVSALLDANNRLVTRVTLKEGVRVADVPALIASKTKIPLADLQAAVKNPSALGLPAQANGHLEGWLFPATYDVQPSTTAEGLLSQMVQQTVAELDSLSVPAAAQEPTLIKASLVQAEARLPQDFPKIARVFDNRLAKGMKLQLDTTVHYATGRYSVSTTIADTKVNSPYNTYVVPGLPIGPIDNPGDLAIRSVLSPAAGSWLYFVAVNPSTGETAYADTPQEFAVIEAQYNAWAKAHPGQ